jgi:hypothetical protein
MIIESGVNFPVVSQQLFLELNLLAGIENIYILIVPVPGELMHRRFIILDKVLACAII